jgi:hypothetical protein
MVSPADSGHKIMGWPDRITIPHRILGFVGTKPFIIGIALMIIGLALAAKTILRKTGD